MQIFRTNLMPYSCLKIFGYFYLQNLRNNKKFFGMVVVEMNLSLNNCLKMLFGFDK